MIEHVGHEVDVSSRTRSDMRIQAGRQVCDSGMAESALRHDNTVGFELFDFRWC